MYSLWGWEGVRGQIESKTKKFKKKNRKKNDKRKEEKRLQTSFLQYQIESPYMNSLSHSSIRRGGSSVVLGIDSKKSYSLRIPFSIEDNS